MRAILMKIAGALAVCAIPMATLVQAAVVQKGKDAKRGSPRPGLVMRIDAEKTKIRSGKDLRIKVTLVNQGTDPVMLVLPGDGSNCGWRTPIVGWSVLADPKAKHPERAPLDTNRFCGNINRLKPDEVFTLQPKQSKHIDGWLGLPPLARPGTYRLVFYYTNEPGRAWRGIPLGRHDEKTMKKVKTSLPCAMRSNELIVKVIGGP
jgi:hypothetical protein